MDKLNSQLSSLLNAEESLLKAKLSNDFLGLEFLTLIKEFDYYFYNYVRHEPTEETSEHLYLLRLGFVKVIQKTLESVASFKHPIVTFRNTKELISSVLLSASRFGFIEHGRRLLTYSSAGDCELTVNSKGDFHFSLKQHFFGLDHHEASVLDFHVRQNEQNILDFTNKHFPEGNLVEKIESLLEENVFLYAEHYIGYEADPLLDVYFFHLAYVIMQRYPVFDSFRYDLKFGGINYQHYFLGLCYIVSLSLKHTRFCETLKKKHPEVDLRNILSLSMDRAKLIPGITQAINIFGDGLADFRPITNEESTQVYSCLSVGRTNSQRLDHGYLPFLIEFSNAASILSVAGCQFNPCEFFLQSLKEQFPTDYDKNQNQREKSMQHAAERILSETFVDLRFIRNLKIKENSKILTDIDLVAIDIKTESVILVQLKHQDDFGGNLKKRYSSAERLLEEVQSWLNGVNAWLSSLKTGELNSALQLKKRINIRNVFTLAICKNFAHILAPLTLNDRFAYATWIQFHDAVARIDFEDRPKSLVELFSTIDQYMSHKVATAPQLEGSDEYILELVKFKVSQLQNDQN